MSEYSDNLVKFYMMNLQEKILYVFGLFIDRHDVQSMLDLINEEGEKTGIIIRISHIELYEICFELYVKDIGALRIHRAMREDSPNDNPYELRFFEGDNMDYLTRDDLEKDTCHRVCQNIVPFMLSHGTNKVGLPLLIHDVPELAQWALEYK